MGATVRRFGHIVKLMAPKFVTPYRKSGKNDGNDAEAICEAVARPNMRFVPVKSTRAAVGSDPASRAPGIRRGAHRDAEPAARLAGRVRSRDAAARS